jgi:hypothetical protein
MKIIFSYVTNNNAPSQSSVELAALSNFLVKKQNLNIPNQNNDYGMIFKEKNES